MIGIKVKTGNLRQQLRQLESALERAAERAIAQTVQIAESSAKRTTLYHDRKGRLRRRTVGKANGFKGRLVANTPYAHWVETGTKPHNIVPRNGKVLVFKASDRTVFTRRVRHPGTKPRPFMETARREGEAALPRLAYSAAGQAIHAFNG